jgi:putative acetyltransferase
MSATAAPNLAMRPYLPADTPVLAEIFRLSIEELTGDDYNEDQQRAWASIAADEEEFAAKLSKQLVLIAMIGGEPVGFASLEGTDHLDLLYVHPAIAGHGAGSMLCDAMEKLAAARGAQKLIVDASDTSQDFFKHRGYEAQRRNTIERDGEWLANTTMHKQLVVNPQKPGQTS